MLDHFLNRAVPRAIVIVAAVLLWVLSPMSADASTAPMAPDSAPVITEDMPGWDCRTMGNRVCGVSGVDGAHVYLVCHDVSGHAVTVVGAPEQCEERSQ